MNVDSIFDLPRSIFGGHVALMPPPAPARSSATAEERLLRLELESAGQDMLSRYAYLYDAKDLERLLALYTDDSTLINSSGTYAGKAAIRAAHEADLPRTRYSFHHFTNMSVSGDESSVTVTAYLLNLAERDGQAYATIASVILALVAADGVWKIRESRVALTARHPLTSIEFAPPEPPPWATDVRTSSELIGS